MSKTIWLGLALLTLIPAGAVQAQEIPWAMPGTAIRVVGPGSTMRAYFHSATADTVYATLMPGIEPAAISLAHIRAILATERRSRTAGALLGAKWGGPLFGAFMGVDCLVNKVECRDYWEISPSRGDAGTVISAATYGILGGVVIGGAIGAIWPGDRHVPIWVSAGPRAAVHGSGGGIAVSLPVGGGGSPGPR